VYFDSRLRECNYGDWNGAPVAKIASTRSKYIFQRYPNGQSYTDVVGVMAGFLVDLATNWGGHRVLIVGPTKINLAKTAVESGLWPIRHLGADK
jgi:broad specificity phosphatase PhoE